MKIEPKKKVSRSHIPFMVPCRLDLEAVDLEMRRKGNVKQASIKELYFAKGHFP